MANERLRTPLSLSRTYTPQDADGNLVALTTLVAAVNQSAERIERLRGALDQALSLAKNPYWIEKSDTREAIIKIISAALEANDNG